MQNQEIRCNINTLILYETPRLNPFFMKNVIKAVQHAWISAPIAFF
jgi:hypothetical protein